MPKFKIIEQITEVTAVEAATAQEALDIWLQHGHDHPAVSDETSIDVEERTVEDEDCNPCDVVEKY